MIAMTLMCEPIVIIADEPTTALDVTIQAQILHLLSDLQKEYRMALVLITHDLGVVARMADRVMVMYAGQVVETGAVEDVFAAPMHPYTQGSSRLHPRARQDAARARSSARSRAWCRRSSARSRAVNFAAAAPMRFAACAAAPVPLRERGPGRASRCLLDSIPNAPATGPFFAGVAR